MTGICVLASMRLSAEDPRAGRVILLNGASSSGKSSLATAIQRRLPEPFLHLSADLFLDGGALAERRDSAGDPFGWWAELRPRFFAGFHRCIPALAGAGTDLIVEHVIEFAAWRTELAELLAGLDVFLVAVHCDQGELDRRERDRGDRQVGEARAHVESNRIHEFGPADAEVDTTAGVTDALADAVVAGWHARGELRALGQE